MTGIRQTSGPKAPTGRQRPGPARGPSEIATELYRSMKGGVWGFGTQEDALFAALGGLTPTQLDQVRAHYSEHYGRSLDDDIRQELGGLKKWRADQILSGKPAVADAEGLRKALGWPRHEDAALEILERNWTAGTLRALAQKAPVVTGYKLRELLEKRLSKSGFEYARALLDNSAPDIARAAVARAVARRKLEPKEQRRLVELLETLGEGRRYIDRELRSQVIAKLSGDLRLEADALLNGHDVHRRCALLHRALALPPARALPLLSKALEGTSCLERQRIQDEFDFAFASPLVESLRATKHRGTAAAARELLDKGRLDPASKVDLGLRYKLAPLVLDGIHAAGRDGLQSLVSERASKTGLPLDQEVGKRFQGLAQFELEWALAHPGELEDCVEYVEALHAFTRDGLRNGPSRFAMDTVLRSRQGRQFDASVKAVAQDALDPAASPSRVQERVGYALDDFATFDEARQQVGTVAARAGAVAASAAALTVTGGLATPVVGEALVAAAAGAAGRVGAHAGILGAQYDRKTLTQDLELGAAVGVAHAVAAPAAEWMVEQAGLEAADQVFDLFAVPVAQRTSAARRVLADYILVTTHPGPQALQGALSGAMTYGTSRALRAATEQEVWDDGLRRGLTRVAKHGLRGVAMGVFAGGFGGTMAGLAGAHNAIDPVPMSDELSHRLAIRVGDGVKEVVVVGELSPATLALTRQALQDMADQTDGAAVADLEGIYAFPFNQGGGGGYSRGEYFSVASDHIEKDPAYIEKVVAHETGHLVDLQTRPPLSKPLFVLFGKAHPDSPFGKPPFVTEYARTNAPEDFAETHEFLMTRWDELHEDPKAVLATADDPPGLANKLSWMLDNLYPESNPGLREVIAKLAETSSTVG